MELIGLYTVHKIDNSADGSAYPVHSHSSHEILMMCGEECGILIGNRRYTIRKNDVAFIFANETHGLITDGGPVEFLAMQFVPRVCESIGIESALDELAAEFGKSGAVFTPDDSVLPAVLSCLKRICDERTETDVNMYFNYINAVLYELCRNAVPKAGKTVKKISAADKNTELLNSVTDYIGSNLNTITDLSFIGRIFHYSNSHVNRIFRSALGVSVWRYITVKRLDLAYNLISDGYSAKDAAIRCGFGDYSVFYKSFVKHFKKSPADLKRQK